MNFRRLTVHAAFAISLLIYFAMALGHDLVATATLSVPGVFRWMFP